MFKPAFLFWKNIYLAISAVLLTIATSFEQYGQFPDITILVSVALLTFAAYECATWYPFMVREGVRLGRHPGWPMILITALSVIAGLVLIPPATIPWLIVLGMLTLFYFMQWNTAGLSGGLRSVFLLKNFLVAGVWTWITVILASGDKPCDLLLTITRFLFILLITLGLDLRDIENDRKLGVGTMATLLGFSKAKKVLLCLIAITILVFALIPFPARIPFLISILVLGIAVVLVKPSTGYWKIFMLMDGNLALHALFMLLFRF